MTRAQQAMIELVKPVLLRYGVRRAALFGSMARGEQTPESDIDLLVELGTDDGLLRFIHLKHEIEDKLGRKVDLVEYQALLPEVRERVAGEQFAII